MAVRDEDEEVLILASDAKDDEEYDELDKVIEAYQNDKIKFEVEE